MHVWLRGAHPLCAAFVAVLALIGADAAPLIAQQEASPTAEDSAMVRFARAHLAVAAARDEFHGRLARTHEAQERARLRDELGERLAGILESHEVTQAEFDRFTLLISSDAEARAKFEKILTDLAAVPRDTTAVSASSRR